jgi:hypothetical protein
MVARITAHDGGRVLNGFVISSLPALLYRVSGPGAPGKGRRAFAIFRVPSSGDTAWLRFVWDWGGTVESVWQPRNGSATFVQRRDGSRDRLRQTMAGYRIERLARGEKTRIDLAGFVALQSTIARGSDAAAPVPTILPAGRPIVIDLGKAQYRQSEESWEEAGGPTARITLRSAAAELVVDIRVQKRGELTFVPTDATNPYDNEWADINGDGIQLYFADETGASAWIIVPNDGNDENAGVRCRAIAGWEHPRSIRAEWRRRADGYELRAHLAHAVRSDGPYKFRLGVVVNEKPPGRERRRGQLVLGGRPGEFVYLRGDREDRERLPTFTLVP